MAVMNEAKTLFQVKIEINGKSYTITKSAETYIDLVRIVNREFGNVIILETVNIDWYVLPLLERVVSIIIKTAPLRLKVRVLFVLHHKVLFI